jgi:hypothetical protein
MAGISSTILPCKIEKTKGKSQISKKCVDMFRCFEFQGGLTKLTRMLILTKEFNFKVDEFLAKT